MVWDMNEQPFVRIARLRLAAPDLVFAELDTYGEHIRREGRHSYDEPLELAMVARGEKLIALGLARNGGSYKVLSQLYKGIPGMVDDVEHAKAVRIACLANQMGPGIGLGDTVVNGDELHRIVLKGDDDELSALMQNPRRRFVLRDAFARSGAFEGVPEHRWLRAIQFATNNEGLNVDDSDEHGPDMMSWDVHKRLWKLLETAPLEDTWLVNLHRLLLKLNPAVRKSPDSLNGIRAVLDRWSSVRVAKLVGKQEGEEQEGYYTGLPIGQEFRCLIAALYGQIFEGKKFTFVGSPNSDDVVLRCAHYGRAQMTVADIQAAKAKDENVFYFAAVWNTNLYVRRELRSELEMGMPHYVGFLYRRRCAQIKGKYKDFDTTPVLETELPGDEETPPKPAEARAVKALLDQVTELQRRISSMTTTTIWGFAILGILVWWRH